MSKCYIPFEIFGVGFGLLSLTFATAAVRARFDWLDARTMVLRSLASIWRMAAILKPFALRTAIAFGVGAVSRFDRVGDIVPADRDDFDG